MSTRATITFIDKDQELVKVYYHYDGYINGLGHKLAKWLCDMKVRNGITPYSDIGFANGVGCLVAQFIRDFKTEAGGIYIEPLGTTDEWIDYNYRVIFNYDNDGTKNVNDITKIEVRNWDRETPIFVGSPKQLLAMKGMTDMNYNLIKNVRIDNWHKNIVEGIDRAKDRKDVVYKLEWDIARKVPEEVIQMLKNEGYNVDKVNNNGLFVKW